MDDRTGELREFFDDCDRNNDGLIEFSEFALLLKNIGNDVSESECRIGFEELDADHDGRIDFDEFVVWWQEQS
ncbi:MAG: EF-hand domain-containing protein [Pseudomonadota bacterium]